MKKQTKKTEKTFEEELTEVLYQRYGAGAFSRFRLNLSFWVKKTIWIIVLESLYFFKRTIDIFVSLILLILLSPVFLFTALAIKTESKGAVFF